MIENPSRETVFSALSQNEVVLIASHGYSEPDPAQSRLFFADIPSTVSGLTSLNIELVEFACLSAYLTSTVKDINFLD